ncbi:MAG: caspase family protein [Chitinophagaceae bacterium]|nr:caspase family protein [Chitinophagaceae bacterium]
MKIGDVKGANKMWNELIKTGVGLDYVCWKMSESNFKEGDVIIGLEAAKKYFDLFRDQKPESAAMITFLSATKVAFALNDRKSLIQINEVASSMKNNIGNTAKYGERVSGIYLKLIDNQFAQVLTDLEDLSEGKGNFIGARVLAKEIFPIYYILINEFDKAEKSIQELVAKNLFIKAKHFTDLTGLIALGKSNYKKAIEELTIYLGLPVFQAPDKFKYYTKRAEAYEGLKEFENAKKDYEAALIYYPDYEPALNSLARLEGRIITERLTDKIAPQIIITEPLAARGIIIEAAGNEVMIKGIATDPGGLKSVTINGEKVYSQEGGTFWGNAVLKEGSNKVTIIATDFSGNNAEKTIEVERPVGASTANAVPVKEGKNYALLIGCQNYDDNTIPSLEDPIPDAIKLKLILKNSYNFGDDNVFTLFNPERSDFKKQFLEIYEVIQPEDNLVIFYAGHGIWIDKDKKGYWMLTDAKLNDVNTWLPNKEVLDMIARVPARHTLLITDACFSGSVF